MPPSRSPIAADTSSPAAGKTCVVEAAAAEFAALIASPTPSKSADAAANTSGIANTKTPSPILSEARIGAL